MLGTPPHLARIGAGLDHLIGSVFDGLAGVFRR